MAELRVNQTLGLLVANAKLYQLSLANFQVEVIESDDKKMLARVSFQHFKCPLFLLSHIKTQYRRSGAKSPIGRYFLNILLKKGSQPR